MSSVNDDLQIPVTASTASPAWVCDLYSSLSFRFASVVRLSLHSSVLSLGYHSHPDPSSLYYGHWKNALKKSYNMSGTAEAATVVDQTFTSASLVVHFTTLHHIDEYAYVLSWILTDSGGVLEFRGPILAAEILTGFPRYGIFQPGKAYLPGLTKKPLLADQPVCRNRVAEKPVAAEAEPVEKSFGAEPDFTENLVNGLSGVGVEVLEKAAEGEPVKMSCGAGSEVGVMEAAEAEPVKKSFCAGSDFVENLAKGSSALEVLPSGGDGVWRVKLVIETKQLEELFSENGDAGALIETMRMAAGGGWASTPKKTKSLWGGGGGWRKSNFSNLL
ncbi:hypothetical protein D8674_011943 [Pyrus ussuriensis x Pyrus communis]|uniref:Uncharacterized protein n=1 Tax=Pyrus ussuriensis x Pyrus communis TaxID=2448454 RepID=A0A5N5G056_9ROSA|nr:hypothetical protein D8674_011943 [Pyrus ussuriensis x Pyrus communis]